MVSVFLCLSILPSHAEKASIIGEAPEYKGKEARLIIFEDYLTRQEVILDSAKVSIDGSFELETDLRKTREALIRIDDINGKIFLRPGREYSIEFPPLPEDQTRTINRTNKVELIFKGLVEDDPNTLIIDLNLLYEHFFVQNYKLIARHKTNSGGGYRPSDMEDLPPATPRDTSSHRKPSETRPLKTLIDSFKTRLDKRYNDVSDPYFKTYKQYVYAKLDEMVIRDQQELYARYFKEKPVQYHHHEYMAYFQSFYEDHMLDLSFHRTDFQLGVSVNEKKSLSMLMDQLKKDEFLEDQRIRELVAIEGLAQLYHDKHYEQKNVMTLLDSLVLITPHEETRMIARNVISSLTRLTKGSRAPSFSLLDQDTVMVSLQDLLMEDKPIYLSFFATWNKQSRTELRIIQRFQKDYGASVRFVSICIDENLGDMMNFLEEHPDHNWTFLHLGGKRSVRDAYGVYSVPTFFLIGKNGKLRRAPAFKPSGKAENDLYKIHKKNVGNGKVKVWDE